jgi:hypothetical protein
VVVGVVGGGVVVVVVVGAWVVLVVVGAISGVDSVVPATLVVLVGIVDGVEGGAEGRVVDVVVVPSSATTVVDAARLVVAVRTGDGASVTCPRTLPTAAEAISTDTAVTVNHAAMSPRFLFTRP